MLLAWADVSIREDNSSAGHWALLPSWPFILAAEGYCLHSQAVPACPRRQGPCTPGISCSGRILIKRSLSVQGIVKSWYSHCQQQSPRAKQTDQTDICSEDRQAKNGLLKHNQNPFLQDKSQPPAKGASEETPRRHLQSATAELLVPTEMAPGFLAGFLHSHCSLFQLLGRWSVLGISSH